MKSNATAVALALLAVSVLLYMGVITPLSQSLLKARNKLTDAESNLAATEMNIRQSEEIKGRVQVLEKQSATNRATCLVPVLNSYAMRVKALVDTMASEAGLEDVEYIEGDLIELPLPKELAPALRTARRTVRIKATADYAAAISFLLRVEKDMPVATLQSLAIHPSKALKTEQQDVEFIFEWPVKDEVTK